MTTAANTHLRHIMRTAHALHRAHQGGETPYAFADALRAAWSCRRSAVWATLVWADTPQPRRHLRLRSMAQRPISYPAGGQPRFAIRASH
jgi:hypothetical protein